MYQQRLITCFKIGFDCWFPYEICHLAELLHFWFQKVMRAMNGEEEPEPEATAEDQQFAQE